MDSSAWYCLYMAPFQLLALYLIWTIGRLSGWAEAKAESMDVVAHGVYSAGYPVAMVIVLLIVLPAVLISNALGFESSLVDWSVFGPVIASLPLFLFGWRTGGRRLRAQLGKGGDS